MKDRDAKATAAQNTRRMAGEDTGLFRRNRRSKDGLCEWFAHCVRPAAGTVTHPILGEVPCCQECALHLDLDLKTP